MKRNRYTLTFITPCFCAGANPLVAEIRASSLRAELRWWFRAVGGTVEQEKAIFGGIAGTITASAIQMRVLDVVVSRNTYQPSYIKPGEEGSYINYYLGASTEGRPSRLWAEEPNSTTKKKGVVRADAHIPHGSKFTLEVTHSRAIPQDAQAAYDLALDVFLRFGSIGCRHTRSFGSWTCAELLTTLDESKKAFQPLLTLPDKFTAEWTEGSTASNNVLNQIETRLKADKLAKTGMRFAHPARPDKNPPDPPTALGYSMRDNRQQSTVRFRPFEFRTKSGDSQMRLLIFQGPDFLLDPAIKPPHRTIALKK